MFKRNSIAWLAVAAVGFIGSALPALAQLECNILARRLCR